MAFTYDLNSSDAAIARRSRVRLLIPDNDPASYELEDEELDFFISEAGANIYAAAAAACDWLARKWSQTPAFRVDNVQVDSTSRAQLYAQRAAELRAQAAGGLASVPVQRVDGYAYRGGHS